MLKPSGWNAHVNKCCWEPTASGGHTYIYKCCGVLTASEGHTHIESEHKHALLIYHVMYEWWTVDSSSEENLKWYDISELLLSGITIVLLSHFVRKFRLESNVWFVPWRTVANLTWISGNALKSLNEETQQTKLPLTSNLRQSLLKSEVGVVELLQSMLQNSAHKLYL